MSTPGKVLWRPSAARIAGSNITAFQRAYAEHCGLGAAGFNNYADWHKRSVENPADFWRFYLTYSGLPVANGDNPSVPVLSDDPMPDTRWFEGATVNYAQAVLHPAAGINGAGATDVGDVSGQHAIIAIHENGHEQHITYAELRALTAQAAAAMRARGVGAGDRIAAVIGNIPEAVALLYACASIGAVFSSCSPDFGEQAAAARFRQIKPRLLFAQPAYSYQGKRYNILPMLKKLAATTAGWQNTVLLPDAAATQNERAALAEICDGKNNAGNEGNATQWHHWLQTAPPGAAAQPSFAPLPFDHPLYVLYSSGTTGLPKAIAHRAGGALLKHHSEQHLHSDIRPGDRVFYFTTCGWMMWNWLVSAPALAATIVLYEGSPAYPTLDALWQIAERHRITFFGVSARYIQGCKAAGIHPRNIADLSAMRAIASTGSPLSPAGFEWIYDEVSADIHTASISGGTDIVGCFMMGNPNAPVIAGQIQAPAAGVDIAAFDDSGNAITDAPGELVARAPIPSMPLKFWNDADGQRYRNAYFSHYPGVWRHGDRVSFITGEGIVAHGRSDATLNPGGVRIGSAEIYRPLEQFAEITDAAAVGKKTGDDEEIWLFVVLRNGVALDDALREKLRAAISRQASPRHAPRRVLAVSQLPRTRSGKTTELAIADVINGRAVANRSVMENPEALDEIARAAGAGE